MRIILFTAALLFSNLLFAQEFSGNPFSYKWKKFKTDTVNIIFPEGLEKTAREIAAIAHFEQRNTAFSIGDKVKPFNIVIQNAPAYSNGYVQIAPKRSEFFITGPQNNFLSGITPYQKTLAVHEYRHIMQYNNFNRGLSNAISYIMGEEGREVLNNAAVPNWFWEGDAVYYETALTNNGRGRIPYFFNQYKALWNAGKHYSFMKLRNGSMKDFIPSHYHLGYMLVAYGREKYGEDFWKKVTDDATAFKGLFYPFQKAIKKHAGISYPEFYTQALKYFESKSSYDSADSGEVFLSHTKNNEVENYYSPVFIGTDSVLVYKESFKSVPAFFLITNEGEKKLFNADFLSDNYFDVYGNEMAYATQKPNARWGYHVYSNIKIKNIFNGESRVITRKSRYFSPSFSLDGEKIVAVNHSLQFKNSLHVLDAKTGSVITEINNPGNYFYSYPKFYNDSQIVCVVKDSAGLTGIAMINIENGSHDFITPPGNTIINFPAIKNDTIFFTASFENADKIFGLDLKDRKIYKITNTHLGNYMPDLKANKMVFTKPGYKGMQLIEVALNPGEIKEVSVNEFLQIENPYVLKLLSRYGDEKIYSAQQVDGNTEKYSPLSGFFNFHSIRPLYQNPEWTLTLYGENVLNTVRSQLYYLYNENEGTSQIGYSQLIGLFYPVISLGGNYTFDRYLLTSTNAKAYYDELNINAGLIVPWNFSGGAQNSSLQISSSYNYNKLYFKGAYKHVSIKGFSFLNTAVSYKIYNRKAVQHIVPRLGLSFQSRLRNSIVDVTAFQHLTEARLNIPSLFKTHNFIFSGAYQQRDTAREYIFSNKFPFSRGYEVVPNYPVMYKAGIDYLMPLAYPDAGFAHIVYINRIRTTLFYDQTTIKSLRTSAKQSFSSGGLELWFDTKWWNNYPLSIGLRYSRLFDDEITGSKNENRVEIMIPFSFLN